jgi:hypothetical protein
LIEENLMELKELEKRIQVLEDVEAARGNSRRATASRATTNKTTMG